MKIPKQLSIAKLLPSHVNNYKTFHLKLRTVQITELIRVYEAIWNLITRELLMNIPGFYLS